MLDNSLLTCYDTRLILKKSEKSWTKKPRREAAGEKRKDMNISIDSHKLMGYSASFFIVGYANAQNVAVKATVITVV